MVNSLIEENAVFSSESDKREGREWDHIVKDSVPSPADSQGRHEKVKSMQDYHEQERIHSQRDVASVEPNASSGGQAIDDISPRPCSDVSKRSV